MPGAGSRGAGVRGVLVALIALVPALSGCGSGPRAGGSVIGPALTVYSSLPLRGPEAADGRSIVNGEKLALRDAGAKVGERIVKFVSADDTGPAGRGWDPEAVSANVRAAADDGTTIAYIGEADSGASAVAIPVLNQAGILQVSPASAYPGLTVAAGAEKGEPDRYYPTGRRSFARIVPTDGVQAGVLARAARDAGCRSTYLLSDRDVYATAAARGAETALRAAGIAMAGSDSGDLGGSKTGALVARVTATAASCVLVWAADPAAAAALMNALSAADPALELFAAGPLAAAALAAGLDPGAQRSTTLIRPLIDPAGYGAPARRFAARYRAAFGTDPTSTAIYGYEAMSAVLAAIARAGKDGNVRQSVTDAFMHTRGRNSLLGRYSITAAGDTSLATFSAYGVRRGKLVFRRALGATGV